MTNASTPGEIKANDRLRKAIYEEQEKMRPRKLNADNKTGHRGVGYRQDRQKFTAEITRSQKYHYLGQYDTKPEAIAAFNAADKVLRA